ncbi:MAG TPA: Type 1 glutamine amidotransferase-like domain-containing protein [Candidatus Saccharimonadales bacterium]|nr:Type 1 glutamine amidotransferase-like domain-containing protein [Candidatus Saccharimonadales bacterium]
MKLLLTSAGITNKSIEKAFFELLGKPFSDTKIAFIPTASNVEPGDKWWLIKDLISLQKLGFSEIDIVDISAISSDAAKERLENADVLYFEGGNTFHLMYWINKLNFKPFLGELLESRVWVGVSAGSMVAGIGIINDDDRIFVEKLGETVGTEGLGYVGFSLKPHYLSQLFDDRDDENIAEEAKQFTEPFYAIDDNTAVVVDGDGFEIVSEGKWKEFK